MKIEDLSPSGRRWPAAAWPWLTVALGLLAMFSHIIAKMWIGWFHAWNDADLSLYHRITDGDSYYTHGPLVLALSAAMLVYLLVRAKMAIRPERLWGNVWLALALLVYIGGAMVDLTVPRDRVDRASCRDRGAVLGL